MNQLVIRNKRQEFLFRFLGGLMLLGAGLQLFVARPRSAVFWIQMAVFVLAAALFFALPGSMTSRITADAGVLTIKWYSRLFKKHIRIDKITGIDEDSRFIYISTSDSGITRLRIKLMDHDKSRSVRKFLKQSTGF